MKSILFILLILFTRISLALDLDAQGYLRAPVGTNSQGGKAIQLQNPGSQGNEFRLGNEVAYGEMYLNAHLLKPQEADPAFFDSNITLAINPAMNSQYGDTTPNYDFIQVIQAYIKGGIIDGVKLSYWAGKRFYRDVDVHMDDFYYYANMSGNGGGVEDIFLGNGTVSLAFFQHSDNSITNGSTGIPSKQALDLRLRDFKLSEKNALNFWAAAAYTAPGNGTSNSTPVIYEAGNGYGFGSRWRYTLSKGYNDLAALYGTGVLQNFLMDNTAYATQGASVSNQTRWRFVENFYSELNSTWALQSALIYEAANNGTGINARSNWLSLGSRAVYYITDHYHFLTEAGESRVDADAEKGTGGGWVGPRYLTRISAGPEVSIGRSYFARPVVRLYASYTFWNDANKDPSDPTSLVGYLNSQNVTAVNGTNGLLQFGVEGEVWY